MGKRVTNWAKTASCSPRSLVFPRSEQEIAEAVTKAARDGRAVRVIGGGHSWSEAAMCDDTLLRLDHWSGILHQEGNLVTFAAGTRIRDINRALQSRGLALPNVGSVDAQTIAGAISTATHGSSRRHGCLSDLVVAVRLVCADGSVCELREDQDAALFRQAVVSFGCFGVLSSVTLRCVPAFRLRVEAMPMDVEEAVHQAVALGDSAEYVKIWWLPHTRRAWVVKADRVTLPRRCTALADHIDSWVVNPVVFRGLLEVGNRFPSLVPTLNQCIAQVYFRPSVRVDDSFRALHISMPPVHLETELAVPLDAASQVLGGVRDLIARKSLRVNFIVELRYVAASPLPLSPTYGRDSVYIGGYCGKGADAYTYLREVEALALSLNGRPHWGKWFSLTPKQLGALYPGWDAFLEARTRLDPEGRFLNPFARRVLGLPS